MSLEIIWSEVCQLLKSRSPKAGDKLTELIVQAKEERLSILTRTIEFLNLEENELIYVFGVYTFIQSILKLMIHSYQLSSDAVCDMLNFVIVEARHFSSPALVKTVAYCLEFMGGNDEVNLPLRWIEVFGKMVAVLATRGEIERDGIIIDGQEYKQEVINSICQIEWGQNNGASLIAVLREIPGINSHDVKMILDKAGQSIRTLEPTSVPPIAYQLLLLSASSFPSLIVGYFDDYFSGLDFGAENNTEDLALMNKRKALGTTVYHFIQRARLCEPLLKELLKRVKASQFHHSLIVSPFMISVCLGLTGIDYVRPVVIDAMKATILKWFMEIHLTKNLKWYHELSGSLPGDSVIPSFSRVIDSRTCELDFLLEGLKDLGIGLLNMDHFGSKEISLAKKQCNGVGDYLLTSLVSKEKDYLPSLMNEFLKNQNSVVNMECLGRCLKKAVGPFARKKCVGRITELIHHLPLMTVETAIPVFKALLPMLQLSYDLLGEVIMVLRKTIWKSIEARRISVTAMILLLSNSRIVGEIPRAKYSCSQALSSSQLPESQTNILGSSKKNESVCFEVLSILRRFFTQQQEVREHLYIGIYNVARQNPELISFLCSHLQTQLQLYMSQPNYDSITLEKIMEFSSGQIILLEPLGFLIQGVGCLLMKSRQIYGDNLGELSDEAPSSVVGCANIIGTWIEAVCSICQEDINKITSKMLPPGNTVEVSFRLKTAFIVQVMQAVEALVEYLCLGGEVKNSNAVFLLFTKFNELKEALKAPMTSKKDKKGKSKNTGKDKDKNSLQNSTIQLSGLNSTAGDFLPPQTKALPPKKATYTHLMATEHLSEIFRTLYAYEGTDEQDAISPLRDNTDFDLFLLEILKQKINSLRLKEPLKEREKDTKVLNGHLGEIARLLWERVNINSCGSEAYDEVSVVEDDETERNELRLHLVSEILEYLFMTFPSDRQLILKQFLNEIPEKPYDDLFTKFFHEFIKHVQNGKKYVQCTKGGKGIIYMFRIFELSALELSTGDSNVLTSVLRWFSRFLGENSKIFNPEGPEPSQAEAILSAFILVTIKKDAIPERLLPLAKHAHFHIGDLDGEKASFAPKDHTENFWLITTKTATTVLHQFAICSENTLTVLKDVMGRLGCAYVEEENVTLWRDNCCRVMNFLVSFMSHLLRSRFPVGPWVDVLRRTAVQFFNIMTSITESFVNSHTKSSVTSRSKRFEGLVRAVGTDFKIRAEAMIHHIEDIRRKALEGADKKHVNSAKINIVKDTKTIPALIYSIEKYEQQLIALCQKTHVNLLNGTRLSAPRDFKIVYKADQPPPAARTTPVVTGSSRTVQPRQGAESSDNASEPRRTQMEKKASHVAKKDKALLVSDGHAPLEESGSVRVQNKNRKNPTAKLCTISSQKTLPRAVGPSEAFEGNKRPIISLPAGNAPIEVAGPSRIQMREATESPRREGSLTTNFGSGEEEERDEIRASGSSTGRSQALSSNGPDNFAGILDEVEELSDSDDDAPIGPTPVSIGNPRRAAKRQLYVGSQYSSNNIAGGDESTPKKMKTLGLGRRKPI